MTVPGHTPADFAVCFEETQFWVTHRREAYGPFDYQWSSDLYGVELFFQGEKFGECCNAEQFFADLKPFRLPQRVVEVAMHVSAALIQSMFDSINRSDRLMLVVSRLERAGLNRYSVQNRIPSSANPTPFKNSLPSPPKNQN
ncbi:MAG: hypothetical protein KDA78_07590 [Planctomycetaceae bacterium]|nr:hypothetical protein [Planctomycetaceae bacterium]